MFWETLEFLVLLIIQLYLKTMTLVRVDGGMTIALIFEEDMRHGRLMPPISWSEFGE